MAADVPERGSYFTVQTEGIYSLKWNHYERCMTPGLAALLEDTEYSMTDVTLACEGQFIQAHKIALAMCSPFFKQFFKMNRVEKAGTTLIALANVKFNDLKNIIQFVYYGEVHLSNNDLSSFLATANMLQVQGLGDPSNNQTDESNQMPKCDSPNPVPLSPSTISGGKRRTHPLTTISGQSQSHMSSKRARLSTSTPSVPAVSTVPQVEVSVPTNVAIPIPPSSLQDISMMHDENEDEEMINLIDVKPESIALYSVNDTVEGHYIEDNAEDSSNAEHSTDVTYNNVELTDEKRVNINTTVSEPGPSFVLGEATSKASSKKKRSVATEVTPSPSDLTDRKRHGNDGDHYDMEMMARRYKCLCGSTFSAKCTLTRHIVEMSGMTNVSCDRCGKRFHRKRNLVRHQNAGNCIQLEIGFMQSDESSQLE